MVRRKVVYCEVHLKEPMLCRQRNGEYGYIKKICRGTDGELLIVEKDGQSYVYLPFRELEVYAPIKENFDKMEGEVQKAGGKASETEE